MVDRYVPCHDGWPDGWPAEVVSATDYERLVAELRKAKAELSLAGKTHAAAIDLLRRVEKRRDEHIRKEIRFYLAYGIGSPLSNATQDGKGEPIP
jgi:hypothetical protein